MVPKYIIAAGGKWYEIPDLKGVVNTLAANPFLYSIPLPTLLEFQKPMNPVPDEIHKTNLIAYLRDDNMLDSIKNIDMSKFQKLLNDATIIIYNDTGSQPEFLEMVTPLIGGSAICIFMFSLAQGPTANIIFLSLSRKFLYSFFTALPIIAVYHMVMYSKVESLLFLLL